MERTKVELTNEKIQWKKIGGGSLRLNGRIIKPGQIFDAKPSDIPTGFRDVVVPLEPIREKAEPPIEVIKVEYTLKQRGKSPLWFDIVDSNDKVLNEKALKKAEAEQLIVDLSK